jgi:hypothetical protein
MVADMVFRGYRLAKGLHGQMGSFEGVKVGFERPIAGRKIHA